MSVKEEKKSFFSEMLYNNPVFGLYLGICSTLAISTSLNNALGMGVSVIFVLVLSNILVSMIARITPDEIHIPVYIVIIATLVTLVGMLLQAYTPELYSTLGAYVDLIVVNCIILGRAEAYACKNGIGASAKDGLMMGLSYTFSLMAISLIRQILGTGILSMSNPFTNAEIFALRLIPSGFEIPIFKSQTGAFLTFAILAAAVAGSKKRSEDKAAQAEKEAKAAAAKAKAQAAKAAGDAAKEAKA